MISKELLSEVLENEVPYQVRVHKIIIKNNSLNYFYNSKDNRGGLFEANEYINIYELANKCKEWALEHDCEPLSCIRSKDRAICDIYSDKYNCKFTHYADTEIKAIFKACQWILDNKKEGN